MRRVRLSLTANGREAEIHPMYDVLANAEFVTDARTMHWNVNGSDLGIMHHVRGDAAAFQRALDDIQGIHGYELTRVDDEHFYAYLMCELTEPVTDLFGSLTRGRLVVNFPIEWHQDGTVSVALIGSSDDIQAAIAGIPEPVETTVEGIGGLDGATEIAEAVLTDRQREVVETALSHGYYEIPRAANVIDVADALGCSESTAAEHLRKAEAKLLQSVFGV